MNDKVELSPANLTSITVPIDCLLGSGPLKHPLLRNENDVHDIAEGFNKMMVFAMSWLSATRGEDSQETHAPFCLLHTKFQTEGFVMFTFGLQDLNKVSEP